MHGDLDFNLRPEHIQAMFEHACERLPEECCGLVGGSGGESRNVYQLRNSAPHPLTSYEAAPEELFAAQREIRERGDDLLGIYHSHPRARDPIPSPTDVRLAFYPSAVYFIIGFTEESECVLRAFRISESAGTWERVRLDDAG